MPFMQREVTLVHNASHIPGLHQHMKSAAWTVLTLAHYPGSSSQAGPLR